jgi:hypothetical protein
MKGELSLSKIGGDDDRLESHETIPSSSRGYAVLTCVTDHLCELYLRTDHMGRSVCIRS